MERQEFIAKTRSEMEKLVEPLRRMADGQRKEELNTIATIMVQGFTEMANLVAAAPLMDEPYQGE